MNPVRIVSDGQEYTVTRETGIAGGSPIPCHRCGICCERWQPLLTPADADRLASHLGHDRAAFLAAYTTSYPFDDERWLLRQEDGHCVFLRVEPVPTNGALRRSGCAVHAERPAICREWQAGLDKRECVQGLRRFAAADGRARPLDLYDEPNERAAFLVALPLITDTPSAGPITDA